MRRIRRKNWIFRSRTNRCGSQPVYSVEETTVAVETVLPCARKARICTWWRNALNIARQIPYASKTPSAIAAKEAQTTINRTIVSPQLPLRRLLPATACVCCQPQFAWIENPARAPAHLHSILAESIGNARGNRIGEADSSGSRRRQCHSRHYRPRLANPA